MCDKHWVIDKIEKLEIKDRENDVIIMTFDPELWTLEDAIETFDAIEAKFPNHNFIGTATFENGHQAEFKYDCSTGGNEGEK